MKPVTRQSSIQVRRSLIVMSYLLLHGYNITYQNEIVNDAQTGTRTRSCQRFQPTNRTGFGEFSLTFNNASLRGNRTPVPEHWWPCPDSNRDPFGHAPEACA